MKAYLIPGAFEGLEDRGYQAVLKIYKGAGFEPQFIKIDWKYKTIDDWVEQVKSEVPKKDLDNSLLSGFSWGAMIALAVAGEYANPKRLLLYSLSPYFAEDIADVKKWWFQEAGKRRIASFSKLHMNKLASNIHCPATIFVGSKELDKYSEMKRRATEAYMRIKGSKLIVIDDATHDIAAAAYLKAIKKNLGGINRPAP